MPITCPNCKSDDVLVTCRVLVDYRIEGELCAEQDWLREEVHDDTSEPMAARCGTCHSEFGVVMVGESLAALTLKPQKPTFTHDENGEVHRVSLLLELLDGSAPYVSTGRVYVQDGTDAFTGMAAFAYDGDKPVSCRLDAYEHYRVERPELYLPMLPETKPAGGSKGVITNYLTGQSG